jgi:hypothetical protein
MRCSERSCNASQSQECQRRSSDLLELPCKVIEEVVEEDHGNDAFAPGRLLGVLQLSGSEGDPGCKRAAHAAGSDLVLMSVRALADHVPGYSPGTKVDDQIYQPFK